MKHLFLTVLFLLCMAKYSHAAVPVFSPNGTFVAKDSFSSAVGNADTFGKTIVVTSSVAISADVTVTSDRALKIEKGGMITIPTGKTLTINGPFQTGLYQVFNCVGTGKVLIGSSTIEVYPEWWNDNANPGTTDMTAAVQAAISSSVVSHTVLSSNYLVTTCLNNTNGYRSIKGKDQVGGMITSTSNDYVIDNTGTQNGMLANFTINSATARVGIYYNRSNVAGFDFIQYNRIENMIVNLTTSKKVNGGLGAIGLYTRSMELGTFDQCTFYSDTPAYLAKVSSSGFLPIYQTEGSYNSATSMNFYRCQFITRNWDTTALRVRASGGYNFYNCYIGSAGTTGTCTYGVLLDTVQQCFFQFHVETYTSPMAITNQANGNTFDIYSMHSSTTGIIRLENGNTGAIPFTGNTVKITSGGIPSSNNAGVFSSMSAANTFIVGNNVSVSEGTVTPIKYSVIPNDGSGNINNIEQSDSVFKVNQSRTFAVYGPLVDNAVSYTYVIPADVKLVEIVAAYAYVNGGSHSSEYHTYKYTIPVYLGTPRAVASVSLGNSGTYNDFAAVLTGNSLAISTNTQDTKAIAVYSVTEYYR